MIGPAVDDFVFTQALQMSENDFLTGAKHAALISNEAMREALHGDDKSLDSLERSGSLTSALYSAIDKEVHQSRNGGAPKIETTLESLDAERRRLLDGPVELVDTLLLVGATREYYRSGGELLGVEQQQRHVLNIGSHLSVCGHDDHRLWSIEKQGELLDKEGCSIHLRVSIGDAEREPNTYLFEAAVTGEMLRWPDEANDGNTLQFQLADINGRTNGEFWSTANEVRVWSPLSQE